MSTGIYVATMIRGGVNTWPLVLQAPMVLTIWEITWSVWVHLIQMFSVSTMRYIHQDGMPYGSKVTHIH